MALRRRHRRKYEDPLVAIDGGRVRAAIEWRGLSVNEAATRLRVAQQTLDSVVRGNTKRCHQDLRDRLGTLLQVPSPWLGGEVELMPTLTPWLPYPDQQPRPLFVLDEAGRRHAVPDSGDTHQRFGLPPKYQLAAHECTTEILKAWRRDIERGDAAAKNALDLVTPRSWEGHEWDHVALLLHRMVNAFWWREACFLPPPLPPTIDPTLPEDEWNRGVEATQRLMSDRHTELEQALDPFAYHAVLALMALLAPWFGGTRAFRYDRLVHVLQWAAAGMSQFGEWSGGRP